MNYKVKIDKFSGPLHKLLELIEARHLDIMQISLAEVTADFLDYVKQLGEKAEPGILADFLVIAARLVLIKSKVLLPSLELTEEEQQDIRSLEDQLKLYQEFKAAAGHLGRLWHRPQRSFSRPLFMSLGDVAVFYPPKDLTAAQIFGAMSRLLALLKDLLPETQIIKEAVIKLEEKIAELMERFQEGVEHSFKAIAKGRPRREIIVLFLALLHLLRERLVRVEQEKQFGDIILKKHGEGSEIK